MSYVFLFLPPVVLLIALIAWIRNMYLWRPDPRNPARRYCRKCGQQEEFYVMAFEEGDSPLGWEAVYPIAKNQCEKHKAAV